MPSLADLTRSWLLRQLGLSSSTLTEADLQAQLYSAEGGLASNRKFVAGRYYPAGDSSALSVNALTLDAMYLMPFECGEKRTFDRISFEVTTVAGAGGVCRLGIYKSDANGMPSGLIVDGGTVISTALGAAEVNINASLNPGLNWVAIVAQVAAASVRSTAIHHNPNVANTTTPSGGSGYSSYRQTGVNGALPATATGYTANTVPPSLFLRSA